MIHLVTVVSIIFEILITANCQNGHSNDTISLRNRYILEYEEESFCSYYVSKNVEDKKYGQISIGRY